MTSENTFQTRLDALQARVSKAALALHERNVRPTVTRVRAALGGGSPNDLGPALKRWRDDVLPTLMGGEGKVPTGVPPIIADIVAELWTRATAAAAVEAVGGSAARYRIARTEEANALREEVQRLRDQLQREQQAFGELRAQAARHEAIAKLSLRRADESAARERALTEQLGKERRRREELSAELSHLRNEAKRSTPPSRGRKLVEKDHPKAHGARKKLRRTVKPKPAKRRRKAKRKH